MAKRNKVFIDVEVNGKMQKVAVDAKKVSTQLDNLGKNARTADRNVKGVAQASSGASKNFSKMAQGTGGLVGAYASLAAQLFAVSAAFNFLKTAGQLKSLQEGQAAYSASTGTAMKSLTQDIIAATDAQIAFTEAAQAAAIGTASGLDPEQLTRLGKAAKDASIVLGRDVTDSFNRLVRGVTKAEPELLDELGIILRLDTATEKYARTLGKTKDELTTFERSQAVANEVLEQSEEKYSRILAVTGASVNKFAQLGKAFDDIVNKIKEVAAAVMTPLAEVLIETPQMAFAAIGLLMRPVLMAVLPGLSNVVDRTKDIAEAARTSFDAATKEAEEYAKTLESRKPIDTSKNRTGVAGILSGQKGAKNSILEQAKAGKQLSNRQIKQLEADVQKKKLLNKRELTNFKKHLREMKLANTAANRRMADDYEMALKQKERGLKRFQMKAKGIFASIATFGSRAARVISFAFSAIGWIGLLATLAMTAYQFFKTKEATEETADEFDYLGDKVTSVNEELKNFNKIQNILNEDGTRTVQTLEAMGKALGNYSSREFNKLSGSFDKSYRSAMSKKGMAGNVAFYAGNLSMTEQETEYFEALKKNLEDQIKIGDRGKLGGGTSYIEAARQRLQNFQTQEMTEAGLNGAMIAEANKVSNMSLSELMDPDTTSKLFETIKREREMIEKSNDAKIKGSKAGQRYVAAIKAVENGTASNTKELQESREGYKNLTKEVGQLTRIQEENAKTAKDLRQSLFPETKYEKYIKTLQQEIALQQKLGDDSEAAKPDADAAIKLLEKEVDLMDRLNSLLAKQKSARDALNVQKQQALGGATFNFEKKGIKRDFAVREAEQLNEQLLNKLILETEIAREKDGVSEAERKALDSVKIQIELNKIKLAQAREEADALYDINQAFTTSFESGLTGAFDSIITGTKGVKAAFADMATGILRALSKVLAEMMAMYIIKQLIMGFSFEAPGYEGKLGGQETLPRFMPGERNGGIVERGMSVPGYATGGIARGSTSGYPVMLHGTEAVVPLGSGGRSIPVDMKGSGGTQNNIVVNISSEGRTDKEGSTGPDMDKLGSAVAQAVQVELQNQKRSGGILNPYGVA